MQVEKVSFEELGQDFINDYKINGKKSLDRAERNVNHLKTFFEGMRAVEITTDKVKNYILLRQEKGAKNGTINRELSALKRMFTLANQMTPPKVSHVPYIPRLKESNPRTGYFEHEEYISLRNALPEFLKPIIIMAYYTGMRKEEILSLKWLQVDLREKRIMLEAGTTKNGEARVIFMDDELYQTIVLQKAIRDKEFPGCLWVFFNHETGENVKSFRRPWKRVLKETELTGMLFHDFRRTAIRNMVRAGVPERVAMMISGHKTRYIFERYNIIDETDLKRASKRVTEFHKTRNGDNLVTIDDSGETSDNVKYCNQMAGGRGFEPR